MLKKERFRRFIDYFTEHYPEPETELNFGNPFELLVAVFLSAQCTDKRINQITPGPVRPASPNRSRWRQRRSMRCSRISAVCSYPNNKAKHLVGMARALMERFGGGGSRYTRRFADAAGCGAQNGARDLVGGVQ